MAVWYKGLTDRVVDPIELIKIVQDGYGGDDFRIEVIDLDDGFFSVNFNQNMTEEQRTEWESKRPFERKGIKTHRMLSVFIGERWIPEELRPGRLGTHVMLGHSGDCRER